MVAVAAGFDADFGVAESSFLKVFREVIFNSDDGDSKRLVPLVVTY